MSFVDKILTSIFGNKADKDLKPILPLVSKINAEYQKLTHISNDELRQHTAQFRTRIAQYVTEIDADIQAIHQKISATNDIIAKENLYTEIDKLNKERDKAIEEVLMEIAPRAFAVVKETARRFSSGTPLVATATPLDLTLATPQNPHITLENNQVTYANTWAAAGGEVTWNMVHYDVQLIGGMVLHKGNVSEMATGEGKTLVATLPAYLNGLTALGVHIVTVNDYLARRDSEWMAPLLNFLGITVDCIDKHQPNTAARRQAYLADITYGTNNEFGFDYLRDNMVRTPEEMVQRKHHYAMVDEVDSVLIDDARTPLIISGPVEKSSDEQQFHDLKPRIERLVDAQSKLITALLVQAKKQISEGKKNEKEGGLALFRAHRGLPKYKPLIKFLSEQGIKTILNQTENYYLQEQGRRMQEADKELYFTIDEKNNSVDLTEKGIELITQNGEDPNFFLLPDVGSIIADIEKTRANDEQKMLAKEKLMQDYEVKAERIHTVNQLLKAYTLFEKNIEYIIDDDKVKIVDEQTGRVLEGRRYSDGLHQALEAKENVKVEDPTQTYATITLQNYFRMYHKLAGMTGTAETEAGELWEIYKLDVIVIPTNRPIVRNDRQDLIYKTAREKYKAVIDEITTMREKGRPVLVGTTSVEISELLSRLLRQQNIPHNVLNAKHHAREAEIVAEAGKASAVTIATNMAGRGTDIKLGEGVKEAGGLAIIGTERHESRRVDRQLRGRAGRQGDPGSSQFFVSLEDSLMRLFGSDRIAAIMDRMSYQEGEALQHSMLTNSIERAQKKVEENNFGIRKRLLDYDEVMNAQRKIIYKKRKNALFGQRLAVDIQSSIAEICDDIVQIYREDMDFEGFQFEILRHFAFETKITKDQFNNQKPDILADTLYNEAADTYEHKKQAIKNLTQPLIADVFENHAHEYKNIFIPFTDGLHGVNALVDLENAYQSKGNEIINVLEKSISLTFIDNAWKEHLRAMDDLKQSVQSAVYEQKDPLLIYKHEAFKIFKGLMSEINQNITAFLFKCIIPIQKAEQVQEAEEETPQTDLSHLNTNKHDHEEQETPTPPPPQRNNVTNTPPPTFQSNQNTGGIKPKSILTEEKKLNRNDPCYCGSGKKYKNCHGK